VDLLKEVLEKAVEYVCKTDGYNYVSKAYALQVEHQKREALEQLRESLMYYVISNIDTSKLVITKDERRQERRIICMPGTDFSIEDSKGILYEVCFTIYNPNCLYDNDTVSGYLYVDFFNTTSLSVEHKISMPYPRDKKSKSKPKLEGKTHFDVLTEHDVLKRALKYIKNTL